MGGEKIRGKKEVYNRHPVEIYKEESKTERKHNLFSSFLNFVAEAAQSKNKILITIFFRFSGCSFLFFHDSNSVFDCFFTVLEATKEKQSQIVERTLRHIAN